MKEMPTGPVVVSGPDITVNLLRGRRNRSGFTPARLAGTDHP